MADVNYINPSSLDPGVGFKPEGFLGGMEWQKRNQMFNDAQSLQQLMSTIGAKKAAGELGEWEQATPVRQAKNLADLATYGATAKNAGAKSDQELANLQATGRSTNASAQKTELDNTFTSQTQSTAIARKIAEDTVAQGTSAITGLKNHIEGLKFAYVMAATQGPQGPAAMAQHLKSVGIPDNEIRTIIGDGSPKSMQSNLKRVMDILIEADVHTQAELRKQKLANEGHLAVQGLANQGSLAAANARANARTQSLDQMLASAKTPAQIASIAQQILAEPDVDPKLKARATAALAEINRQLENQYNKGNPSMPGNPLAPAPYQQPTGLAPGDGVRLPRDPSTMSNEELLRAINGR